MIIHIRGDVVKLKGSLSEDYWPALKSAVTLLLREHPSGVIIDGSGLTEINSAGAHTFTDASNYIQAQRARVFVAGLPEHILAEIRQIPGARSQLPIASTVEEARASLAVGGVEAVPEARRRPAILVPLFGEWRKMLEPALHQATAEKAEIHLLYVLEVPRALPLGVPIPDKEQEAQSTLSEAEQALKGGGVTVRRLITRARGAAEGVGGFAAELMPRLVLVGLPKSEFLGPGRGYETLDLLCHETSGDLAIYCVGARAAGEPEPECRNVMLVPLLDLWPKALEFTATQAAATRAELHLLYVIQVPRTQPIDVPLPDKEQDAQQTLMEAERMLKRRGVTVRKLTTRARDPIEGVGKTASETNAELVVIAYPRDTLHDVGGRFAAISTLCNEAPCDVAVLCVAQ